MDKKICVLILLITSLCTDNIFSQFKNLNIGAGYFGEMVTHPGVVIETEIENRLASQAGILTRIDMGFYDHPRSHDALFLEAGQGFRRYFNNGLFFEQYIALGTMAVFYNEDVWHINSNGDAVRVSRFGNLDFMPSVTTGVGYMTGKDTPNQKLFWIRPKIFWQLPFNNHALAHLAIQAGLTFTLKSNEKK